MASIIRLDKVKGYPISFKNTVGELENGQFLSLKGLIEGDREAYEVEKATKSTTGTIVLHASVPVMYDERLMEQDFVLKQDAVGRAYIPERGDIVTIAETFGTGAINVNDKVGIDASGKLSTAETTKIAQVIAKEKFSGQDSLVLQFI